MMSNRRSKRARDYSQCEVASGRIASTQFAVIGRRMLGFSINQWVTSVLARTRAGQEKLHIRPG